MNAPSSPPAGAQVRDHPRTIGWVGTSALAMGGSNQMVFLVGALIAAQGSGAVPILIVGVLLGWAAAPGWIELVLMWPKRVGGIAATCAEAFRPYSPVLANLTGVCYWWGWVPTCGFTAILSATALHEWYLPWIPVTPLAIAVVLAFAGINLLGVRTVTRFAIPVASAAALLALLSAVIPIFAGTVDYARAVSFSLDTPFDGFFGVVTSAMAGLYLVGFAAPAFEAADLPRRRDQGPRAQRPTRRLRQRCDGRAVLRRAAPGLARLRGPRRDGRRAHDDPRSHLRAAAGGRRQGGRHLVPDRQHVHGHDAAARRRRAHALAALRGRAAAALVGQPQPP